jgi:glutaredoxin
MIVIYGNDTCVYCRKAKKLAEQYNLAYEWKDTDKDLVLNELKNQLPNAKTIPQIWWNGDHIGGYEDFAIVLNNTIGGYGKGSF